MRSRPFLYCLLASWLIALPIQARAELKIYRNPSEQGYRLAYCTADGRQCGEPVAAQWCRSQGYEFADRWQAAPDIGTLEPTLALNGTVVCATAQCDGFASITCGREGRTYRLPTLGAAAHATVLSPDRRSEAPALVAVEQQLVVPGCHQRDPGVLLCESIHDYQHCRSLFAAGKVLGCRAGLAFEGAFADPYAAPADAYDLQLKSSAVAMVRRDARGQGRVRGDARYELRFAMPEAADTAGCLQRDPYVYLPTGPRGGSSELGVTAPCSTPITGRFAPHDDDLLRAYDLCAARQAWGSELESSIDILVAALFTLAAPADAEPLATRIVAPYVTIKAPLRIDCRP